MKKLLRILSLLAALVLLAVPALAEDDDFCYEDGNPPVAPDINLPANPSTGYQWTFTVDDEEVLEVFDNGFLAPDAASDVLGAPGTHTFRLYGAEFGTATVTFTYARSWEDKPLYTLTLHVQVDEAGNACIFQMAADLF